MKLGLVITGLLTMLVAASVQATTLKLAPDIDLLVLDGRKISGSLLKGAEGLELERGQHQVLFRIEKTLPNAQKTASPWLSTPLIVTFDARVKSITIALPDLTTSQQTRAFNKRPEFKLLDETGKLVSSQQDRLTISAGESFEQAMMAFNLQGKPASVPRFAQAHASSYIPPAQSGFASADYPGGRVLQLWYQQVDSATRQRFILLMRALHTS